MRPAEVELLVGNPKKAQAEIRLGNTNILRTIGEHHGGSGDQGFGRSKG